MNSTTTHRALYAVRAMLAAVLVAFAAALIAPATLAHAAGFGPDIAAAKDGAESHGPYVYMSSTSYLYHQRSPYRVQYGGHSGIAPAMYNLINGKDGSIIHVYCADAGITAYPSKWYKKISFTETEYSYGHNSGKVAAIIQNSYPNRTAQQVASNAGVEDPSTVDDGQVITATQLSLWRTIHNDSSYDFSSFDASGMSQGPNGSGVSDPIFINDSEKNNGQTLVDNGTAKANIDAMVEYLTGLASVSIAPKLESSVECTPVQYNPTDNYAEALITIRVKNVGSGELGDEFTYEIENTEDGSISGQLKKSENLVNGDLVKTIDVKVKTNTSYTVNISGGIRDDRNVYIYTTEGGKQNGQTYVGIGEGISPVSANAEFIVNTSKLNRSLTLVKKGDIDNVDVKPLLEGAEFALDLYAGNARIGEGIDTATTDGYGKATFDNLSANLSSDMYYQVRETKAPNGYEISADALTEVNNQLKDMHGLSANLEFDDVMDKPLPVTVYLHAYKQINGDYEGDQEFTFELNGNGTNGLTESIQGTGEVSFGPFEFDKPGTYFYTIKEQIPKDLPACWTYDDAIWDVTVYIELNREDNTLSARTSYARQVPLNETGAIFTNRYNTRGSIKIHKSVVVNQATGGYEFDDFKRFNITVDGPHGYHRDEQIIDTQTIQLDDLEPGTYTVKEDIEGAQVDGFQLDVDNPEKTVEVVIGENGLQDKDKIPEVNITNKYTQQLGSLTLWKRIEGDAPLTGKHYGFKIQGPINSPTFAPNTIDVETWMYAGEHYTLQDIPVGDYIVKELDHEGAAIDGYNLTVAGECTGEDGSYAKVSPDASCDVIITNMYDAPGELSLTKTVRGDVTADEKANKTYTFVITSPDFDYYNEVTLQENEVKTIKDLPKGNYTVTERRDGTENIEGYALTVTGEHDETNLVTVDETRGDGVEIVNRYDGRGSLTINKVVMGLGEALPDETFTFDITGPNDFSETKTLKGGESVTLANLPLGTYRVSERNANIEGYSLEVTGEGTATIAPGANVEMTITNRYEKGLGSLTINKVVLGLGEALPDETFTFDITGPNGYTHSETITGSGSVTVNDLQPGDYTVTERDASIEGYVLRVTGEGTTTVKAGSTASVNITNRYTEGEFGSLTIHKTVAGPIDPSLVPPFFTFTVSGPDGFNRTVTVPAGGSTTIGGLLPGEYTIEEDEDLASVDGFDWHAMGDDLVDVVVNETTDATITNYYDTIPLGGNGTITLNKRIVGGGAEAQSKVFTFDVFETRTGTRVGTMTITGEGTAQIRDLPVGEYLIVERNADIDGFVWSPSVENGGRFTIVPDGQVNTTITNNYTTTVTTNSNNGNSGNGGNFTTTGGTTNQTMQIPDGNVPLASAQTTRTSATTTPSGADDTVQLYDEDVPLGYLPKTGDATNLMMIAGIAVVAGAALAVAARLLAKGHGGR